MSSLVPRPGSRLSVAPVAQARRVERLRERSRWTALNRGRNPEPPGKGAPNRDTPHSEPLDVRQKRPERQTFGRLGAGREETQGKRSRSGGETGVESRRNGGGTAPLHPGPAGYPLANSERDTPHHGLRQTRRPSQNCHMEEDTAARLRRPGAARSCRLVHRRLPPEGRPLRFKFPPHTLAYTASTL
jgi:hypothetical protein